MNFLARVGPVGDSQYVFYISAARKDERRKQRQERKQKKEEERARAEEERRNRHKEKDEQRRRHKYAWIEYFKFLHSLELINYYKGITNILILPQSRSMIWGLLQ